MFQGIIRGNKKMKNDKGAQNEDTEIWRRDKDDYYSPSIFVTKQGNIGINVSGECIIHSVEYWHNLANLELKPKSPAEKIQAIEEMGIPVDDFSCAEFVGYNPNGFHKTETISLREYLEGKK